MADPNLKPYARCQECGPLDFDGTWKDADKVAEKHTKTTGHGTSSGVRNPTKTVPRGATHA